MQANVENLDRTLDELEQLAFSEISTARLSERILEQLAISLGASGSQLLVDSAEGWLALVEYGQTTPELTQNCLTYLSRLPAADVNVREQNLCSGTVDDGFWLCVPCRSQSMQSGCLTVQFPKRPPESLLGTFGEVTAAFASIIADRQTQELESFLGSDWPEIQTICSELSATDNLQEAASILSNGLVTPLNAARVSVSDRAEMLTVSGSPITEKKSRVVRAIFEHSKEVIQKAKTLVWKEPKSSPDSPFDEEGLFQNRVAIPLDPNTCLQIEFSDYRNFVTGLTKLSHLVPTLETTWRQHSRWLGIPKLVRKTSEGKQVKQRSVRRLVKGIVGTALISLIGWLLLRPSDLVIEAEGTHEPVQGREIFATSDGFVEQVFVRDGDKVEKGQPLVLLRSPGLELQMEELEGKLRSTKEQLNGLRVALNQLDPSAAQVQLEQSRIAARIAEFELQERNLGEQLNLLASEKELLTLKAPIKGFVVRKDLYKQLQDRPVSRGNNLLRILNLNGPWQLRLTVADKDSQYLFEHFQPDRAEDSDGNRSTQIDYVFVSRPTEHHIADITWISDKVEYEESSGCFLEIRAETSATKSDSLRAGASVHANLICGTAPTWFVWSRPIVESFQRRWWLSAPDNQ